LFFDDNLGWASLAPETTVTMFLNSIQSEPITLTPSIYEGYD